MLSVFAWHGINIVCIAAIVALVVTLRTKLRGERKKAIFWALCAGIVSGLAGVFWGIVFMIVLDISGVLVPSTDILFSLRLVIRLVLFVSGALIMAMTAESLLPRIRIRGATRAVALIVAFAVVLQPLAYWWPGWAYGTLDI